MTTDECLWQSASNILRAQDNLNLLFDAFDAVECDSERLKIELEDADKSDGDFIQAEWNAYYSVKTKTALAKGWQSGWLTLAIQLTCNESLEARWDHGKRAKVLVGYVPLKKSDEAWGFDADGPNSAGYRDKCVMRELYWQLIEDNGRLSWFYALPLDLMTSTQAVKKLIVDPVHSVLRSETPQDPSIVLAKIKDKLCCPPPMASK
ncbi:hypothetical protein [Thioclava sp. GXIMD4216]|uniref:hypothetical protein n=1 Tax=Thioclava sp. GXIMD4216 TaxID=3131929 RepID=UPI0030D2A0E0